MSNLDRLLKLIEFDSTHTFKFTETESVLMLELEDSVFKQYVMKGEDIEAVKDRFFWYIVENFMWNFKPKTNE